MWLQSARVHEEGSAVTRSLLETHELILSTIIDTSLPRKQRIEKAIKLTVELDSQAEWIRRDLRRRETQ